MADLLRATRRLTMAPDTAERHSLVARLAGTPPTVLDVGGERGGLHPFLPSSRVTAINVTEDADERFDGRRLPYPDAAFDTVTSLDVLEHIRPADRPGHIAECARVAARAVVLCFPLGTPGHAAAERQLASWYRERFGRPQAFLEEHLEHGLPTVEELESLRQAAPAEDWTPRLLYHGDYRETNRALRTAALARRRPTPAHLLRYVATLSPRSPSLSFSDEPEAHTNRAYLFLQRTRSGETPGRTTSATHPAH